MFSIGTMETSLVRKKISAETVLRESQKKCCNDSCLSSVSLEDVIEQRRRFWSKLYKDRTNYVDNVIEQTEQGRVERSGKSPSQKRMLFNGLKICVNAWCVTHGISRSR